MKKDLGVEGMIILSLVLSLLSFVFLPVFLSYLITLPAAFILGIIALMRSTKEKIGWKIFLSILAVISPLIVFGYSYLSIQAEGERSLEEAREKVSEYNKIMEESEKEFEQYKQLLEEKNKTPN